MSEISSPPPEPTPTSAPASAAPAPAPPLAPPGVATAPTGPTTPAERPRSRSWLGVLAALVVVAMLAGATAVLFVRVQEAQDRADEAVVLAGNQESLATRIDELDASLAAIQSSTSDDLDAARSQVVALRKCVNNALESWAQASQSGKPASITKC